MTSRRWCFTLNNPAPEDETIIGSWETKYLVFGREVGDSNTPHLQGFIIFAGNKRLSALKKLHGKIHWEPTKKASIAAATYCKKDGNFFESGEIHDKTKQGERNDIKCAVATIKSAGIKRCSEEHPATWVKFSRGLRDIALLQIEPYTHDRCRGLWIYGPPGTGKSHAARIHDPDLFDKDQNKWFDGYDGEKTILLDDMDTSHLAHHLKRWTDRYACKGETKGGTVHLRHTLFIVTSNYHPVDLFKNDKSEFDNSMVEAICRRFAVVEKTTKEQVIDFDLNNYINE